MSYEISLLVDVELSNDLPDWVQSYLGGLAGADRAQTPAPRGNGPPAQGLPKGDWFSGTTISWEPEPAGRAPSRFHLVGDFHDDFIQHQHALLTLLAHHAAADGPFCARWDTMNDATFTIYAARRGSLLEQTPAQPWVGEDDVDPLTDVTRATSHHGQRIELGKLGASADVIAVHDALDHPVVFRKNVHPTLSRYLLVRSLARVLRDHHAESALEPLLEALDAGVDPAAGPTAPGWRIGETEERHSSVHRAGLREICGGLAAIGRALPGSYIDTGPLQLQVGHVLRTLQSWDLVLPGGLKHTVEPGTELRVHQISPRGFGRALTPDGREVAPISPDKVGTHYEVIAGP